MDASQLGPFAYHSGRSLLRAGEGVLESLPAELEALRLRRPLLVAGGAAARSAVAQALRSRLAGRMAGEFNDLPQHSSVATVEALVAQVQAGAADGFIALGGGSVSDSAKAAAIVLAEGAPLAQHANRFTPPDQYVQRVLPQPKRPIVAIPTTLSAAEVTPGLGIRDEHGHKLLFWDLQLVPRLTLLDPVACDEVPASVLLTTGMNALAHCIEGLYSRVRNPISDGLALQGLRLLAPALRAVAATDAGAPSARRRARLDALVAAHVSGLVISNARVGIHHGVCHLLGSFGGLPHGVANSVLLPHALRFNLEVAAAPLALAAQALGEAPRAEAAISAVECLQAELGVPRRLRDTGLDRTLLPQIADLAIGDRGLYFNPRRAAGPHEVLALLEAAW